ncbi:PF01796 domain protein [Leptospira inadai serovar Lyme str. 10]|uniref:PF01796 domain protein n=2 Tax=Leptospira inadai serovar Lyme TaxID=293084 RepID=V6HFV8_9LEPT|nr:OB-fold domain-containing protein [Leptospira inadai]EQA38798.1 PF01796 domain protein [Leptospira inadai serovar Lyme str. 10]PNV74073.1 hypothetical protein BES34_015355 [Leptospira inadai serovar Lyme]
METLEINVLKGKKCASCGFEMTEPAVACTRCGSDSLQEKVFSGKGKIYTYTVVHVGFGHLASRAPYVLAVIDLEEGPKTMGILEGRSEGKPVTESVRIDMPVTFDRTEPKTGSIFKPTE